MKKLITRKDILCEAIEKCLIELYNYAQPTVDFKQILKDISSGKFKDSDKDPFYSHYYLSHENFKYIYDVFVKAYKINSEWKDYIEIIEKFFDNEGVIRVYKSSSDGVTSHKEYKRLDSIALQIGNENYEIVKDRLEKCKDFYNFNYELNSFGMAVALGCSPSSNKEEVINYWKSQGKDIEIKDFNIDSFLYEDE